MKLLGKDIDAAKLVSAIEERLSARGLSSEPTSQTSSEPEGGEPVVHPLTFNLRALESYADPLGPVPVVTHRAGLAGFAVVGAKWLIRRTFGFVLREALAIQRIFNGHVRDSYAQLSAEVARLQRELHSQSRAKAPKRRAPRKK